MQTNQGEHITMSIASLAHTIQRNPLERVRVLPALLCAALLACSSTVSGQESLHIAFEYSGNHSVDFSGMKGSLQIEDFADERSGVDPNVITTVDIAGSGGYVAQQPVAALIKAALTQGFAHGKAPLTESDADYSIGGALLAVDATTVERAGVENIQITFRTRLELRSGGRVLWSTTLFGRGRVPVEEGAQAAIEAGLNRTVGELVADDYFKMEIL
jgi:hypothetical protein